MQKSIRRLLLFILIMIASVNARSQEVKYYTLVIDKIELPSCLKDTSASGWLSLYIYYDADRRVDLYEKITLSSKSPTITINKKMVDIKREDKINFIASFKESGSTGIPPKGHFNTDNLHLTFKNTFSAISEGKRQFFAETIGHWDDFMGQEVYAATILYWHLEPSKLQ